MSRLFLCLGLGLLAAAAAAALYGSGAVSGEPAPGGEVGAFVFLGLAVLALGSGLLTRRWERADPVGRGRRSGGSPRAWGRSGEGPWAAGTENPAPGPVG